MKIYLFSFMLLLCRPVAFAQVADLYQTDGVVNKLHRANIGRVTFMNGNIPLDRYKSADFLKSFKLTPKSDLNIRVFMDNSVANYLHQLAPDLSPEALLRSGNLQFSFLVDKKLVYTENIHHGCNFGSAGNKNSSTTFRVPLTSSTGEDWWAMYMWDRFMANGGNSVLTEGRHLLRIELRTYVKIPEQGISKVGAMIAEGELELMIKMPVISAGAVRVQAIQPNSGWAISDLPFDQKYIERLNRAIASYELKDITSVVVIREGKLMLEEYFNGASRNTLHDTRSAGKSFAGTLMGLAIRDGYIPDERQTLGALYDLRKFGHQEPKKDSVRIKDLLTMSSAFMGSDADSESPGNEEYMYPQPDWVRFALDLPMDPAKTNGGQWDYFTAGVVVLGDILNKSVPRGLEQYAGKVLFKPLGISRYKWQYTPQKVVNTAGGLQMRSLDYARYAQLYQNRGVWNGKQVLPAAWVDRSLSRHIQIPDRENQFYGYLFWNKTFVFKGLPHETYYCAGNGGNEFVIFQDLPLVVIITSKAFNKPYGHPQTEKIVSDYLLPAILN